MCQGLNFREKNKHPPQNNNKKHHQTINLDFGNNHLEAEWASTWKAFVFHLFLRLTGSKARGGEGARIYFLLISNIFQDILFLLFKLLFQVWVEQTSLDVGWRQECTNFIDLPVFNGEALRQNSKAEAALRAACRQKERSPPQILLPGTNKINSEDTWLSQQCRCHQISAVFRCMNQSSAGASDPACPGKNALTSKERKYGKIPLSCVSQAPITRQHQ